MKMVSFIMGAYNCAKTLPKAIDSLLAQTYPHWELVLCDDGSSDDTYLVAKGYQEKYPEKIRLIKNDRNMGLNYTLNRCLKEARGEFIARQDGDDYSLPERIEKEMKALQDHPEMAFVSTAMSLYDELGTWGVIRRKVFPTKEDLVQGSPFAHAPCLVRKQAMDKVGGYSEGRLLMRVEDFHLWYKMYKAGFRGMNLEEALYACEDDRSAANRRKFRYRLNECYVRWLILRDLKPGIRYVPGVLRPLLVGLLPQPIYQALHRRRLAHRQHE